MALILCLEAGTDIGSAALSENGRLISLIESGESRQHARNLAVFVDEILRENRLTASQLDAVAIGKGPGSYTGLRICTSLAKGICYGAGIPLIAINSLEALCRVAREDARAGLSSIPSKADPLLLPMLDARRMEVYCQVFDFGLHPLTDVEARIITEESFADLRKCRKMYLFGDGSEKCKTVFTEPNVHFISVIPSARGLVKPAYEAYKSERFENLAYFEPFYLKDFLVTTSTKKLL